MLVGRSYRVNYMGGAIDCRVSNLKTNSCSCLFQVEIDTDHTAAGLLYIATIVLWSKSWKKMACWLTVIDVERRT